MLLNGKSLTGYKVNAQDGDAGKVLFFFFDDHRWMLRYLVLGTGSWMGKRKVLLTPDTVIAHDWANQRFDLRITRDTIKSSPEMNVLEPIPCQGQETVDRHYGCAFQRRGEANVHSSQDFAGFSVDLEDAPGGKIEDLVVDDNSWIVPYTVVNTRSWLPGKTVLVPPQLVDSVNWDDEKIRLRLTREQLKDAPAYDSEYPISRDYERRLYDFYGVPGYWESSMGKENMNMLIRQKAQELCRRRGCVPGHELSDWLEAERIVKGELRRK